MNKINNKILAAFLFTTCLATASHASKEKTMHKSGFTIRASAGAAFGGIDVPDSDRNDNKLGGPHNNNSKSFAGTVSIGYKHVSTSGLTLGLHGGCILSATSEEKFNIDRGTTILKTRVSPFTLSLEGRAGYAVERWHFGGIFGLYFPNNKVDLEQIVTDGLVDGGGRPERAVDLNNNGMRIGIGAFCEWIVSPPTWKSTQISLGLEYKHIFSKEYEAEGTSVEEKPAHIIGITFSTTF